MIRIENVDKYFNRFKKNKIHVINHTSLTIEEKGLVALLGPSGSGKTTLLNAIGGLDKVGKGKIFINNQRITKRFQGKIDKIRNLNIGYIFQDYKLIENKTVFENVSISLKLIGIKDKKEIKKRVEYVLDKVGMLRYKKRPCNTLSGGERQRVGIARAIVKNPNIIIADEPTGNLDSKNSLEVMNIIKSISKDKLVILVTHEKELATFFATRVIELEDGKIIKDYENVEQKELKYSIYNNIYLNDFNKQEEYNNIHIYSNEDMNIPIDIAIINNNIYIQTRDHKKIEVIDEDSAITMIHDSEKNVKKEDLNKVEFDFQNIIKDPSKIKYSSIFNPINFITEGFQKVLDYSFLKKILLFGFLLSSIFIVYALSSIKATSTIKDEKFIKYNPNYLILEKKKLNVDEFFKLEQNEDISYILPGDSVVSMKVQFKDYYQFIDYTSTITGSLTSITTITEEDIILGRYPENNYEIVVDKSVLKKNLSKEIPKMEGKNKIEDYLNLEINFGHLGIFKIVGVTDKNHPSIYVAKEQMIPIIYYTIDIGEDDFYYYINEDSKNIEDYHYNLNNITLVEGRWPDNDYETIVDYREKENHKLGSELNYNKINGKKLTIVGYYTPRKGILSTLVGTNTAKIYTITQLSDMSIYAEDKQYTIDNLLENYNILVEDSYDVSKEIYLRETETRRNTSLIAAGIVLLISLIEIYLMIRSSFLSHVKEVGIYRAIGVKKKDIYIMFSGEIIAITTIASIPGILLMSYILNILSKIPYADDYIMMSPGVVIGSILLVYGFNLIVGLIPVFNTMRKRPAEILARTDVQ